MNPENTNDNREPDSGGHCAPSPGSALFSRKQIVAEVAKWAIRQSPYMPPAGLVEACEKLHALLPDGADNLGFFWKAPMDFEAMLHEAIAQVPEIVAWNSPRSGHNAPFVACSRYWGPKPEDDFIDLHALVRNVRMELVREHEGVNPPGASLLNKDSVTFDYRRFEQLAERTVQDAIESASGSPPEGYHELEGSAVAVADDCFLAGVHAMKTAMLNAIFDELNGNGPIDPPNNQASDATRPD